MRMLRACVSLAALSAACSAFGRGGGGCLEEGTLIGTPSGPLPIERLEPGDTVWAVVGGQLQRATVRTKSEVSPVEYEEITIRGRVLRVTADHPLQIGTGTFRVASNLRPGDRLFFYDVNEFKTACIETIIRVKAVRPAFNLLVTPGGTFLANDVVVHNKGCFLPDTPILRADGTESLIRDIRTGDELLAFTTAGEIVHTRVRGIIAYEADEYAVVVTEQTRLCVTREHPFYVGSGTFKTLETLKAGDRIFALVDGRLRSQRIASIERVQASTRVYNLQTDRPNTYFANGVAVHNKGGGCFPAGVRVSTPRGDVAIETLRSEDEIFGVDAHGAVVRTVVESVETTRSALLVVETDDGVLRTTQEHPLLSSTGEFRPAGEFEPGEQIITWKSNHLGCATIRRITTPEGDEQVFNLRVGEPHVFVADGFVVHNKGGGGFGGGYHGGGHSGGGDSDNPAAGIIFLIIVGGIVIYCCNQRSSQKKNENLDYLYGREDIDRKAGKTRKLLEFLSRVDQTMDPGKLEAIATSTFTKLQHCWQERQYGPMESLLMPDLYADHCAQLSGMSRDHEINVISDLLVEHVDIVNVRYTNKENDREFTALISARARDYYIDDRTRKFLRGDEEPAHFQEFWTFHRQDGAWLLREIDQTRESDALKQENSFEQFTEAGLNQVYAETAPSEGPTGPWLEKETLTKATRIERLLNFLVRADKLWNRQTMLERARQVFLHVMLAREGGDPASIPKSELFPEVAASLQNELMRLGVQGTRLEFRNLCVRKVELILVRNFSDDSRDEFTARISAHAQKIVRRNNLLISEDEYVSPFVEYWTFGRFDKEWKLKEVLPPARGQEVISAENVDQDSSSEQLQWYYSQARAN